MLMILSCLKVAVLLIVFLGANAVLTPLSEKMEKLRDIARDFEHTAVHFVELVVSELTLPAAHKTIKPSQLGGVASGAKYFIKGILLKFVTDTELAPGFFMYGGKVRSDANAYKAAGLEIKGLNACFLAIQKLRLNIHVPLMCVVDFRGFRLIAVAALPISKTTLIYGSADGGVTVKDEDTAFRKEVEALFGELNLQPHFVGHKESGKVLAGPGDVEGHLGMDGRFYLLDFARLLPPEYPPLGTRDVFFRVLRPEFVKMGKPLNPDGFSGWSNSDPDFKDHCALIKDSCTYLYNSLIPELARSLNWEPNEIGLEGLIEDEDPLQRAPIITRTMHKHGMNARHLGLLLLHTEHPTWRTIIKTEMVARVIKLLIRDKLRAQCYEARATASQAVKDTIVKFFTEIIALDEARQSTFWTSTVKSLVVEKFSIPALSNKHEKSILSEEELCADYDFLCSIRLRLLFQRLEEMTNLRVSKRLADLIPTKKVQNFIWRSGANQLSVFDEIFPSDLASLPFQSKVIPFVDYAEGALVVRKVWAYMEARDVSIDSIPLDAALLPISLHFLDRALSSLSTSPEIYFKLGELYYLYYKKTVIRNNNGYKPTSVSLPYLKLAKDALQACLVLDTDHVGAHVLLAKVLATSFQVTAAQEHCAATVQRGYEAVLLNLAQKGIASWNARRTLEEGGALPLTATRAILSAFPNHRAALVIHVRFLLNLVALKDFELLSQVYGNGASTATPAEEAGKSMEFAMAQDPAAFDDLWALVDVHALESGDSQTDALVLGDMLIVAEHSPLVTTALFAALEKHRILDLAGVTRWSLAVHESMGDFLKFFPLLTSFTADRFHIDTLKSLSAHCPHLTTLHLGHPPRDYATLLAEILAKVKLQHFTLREASDNAGLAPFAEALSACPLESLFLENCSGVTSVQLEPILQGVSVPLISGLNGVDHGVYPTIASLSNLTSLSLSSYSFTSEGFDTFAATNKTLTKLKLQCSKFGPEGLVAISKGFPQLRELVLDGLERGVTDATFAAFADAPFASSLQTLHLRDLLGISGDPIAHLKSFSALRSVTFAMCGNMKAESVGASLAVLPVLNSVHVDLNGGRWWSNASFSALIEAPHLTSLHLPNVKSVSWDAFKLLFAQCKHLTDLDVSSVPLDKSWPKELFQHCNSLLAKLYCNMTPIAVDGLCDVVEACPNLEDLQTMQVVHSERGILALAKLNALQRLAISLHDFQAPKVLARAVSQIPTLAFLRVMNNSSSNVSHIRRSPMLRASHFIQHIGRPVKIVIN